MVLTGIPGLLLYANQDSRPPDQRNDHGNDQHQAKTYPPVLARDPVRHDSAANVANGVEKRCHQDADLGIVMEPGVQYGQKDSLNDEFPDGDGLPGRSGGEVQR